MSSSHIDPPDDSRPSALGQHAGVRRGIVAILLIVNATCLAWGAYTHSPTFDEMAYLPAGLSHWYFGRFELAPVSPPLVRLVAAAPVALSSPRNDWRRYDPSPTSRSEHMVGQDFANANGKRTLWFFTLARWACIPFSILGGWVSYSWARKLYGDPAGLLALVLWCFSPGLLAHGQLMTPDMGTTSLGVAAGYCFWRWTKRPSWPRAFWAGISLGAAELAKSTLLIFFLLWPALWIVQKLCAKERRSCRAYLGEASQLAATLVCAVYLMNLGYLFNGSFQPLREYRFVSRTLGGEAAELSGEGNRFAGSWMGRIPVPLPSNYLLGLDFQKQQLENADGRQKSYLRGQWQDRGWWYYYLYALLIKAPLGIWVLVVAAIIARCRFGPVDWHDELSILLPLGSILLLVSLQTGFNHHLRYVLPMAPFAFIWTSKAAQSFGVTRRMLAVSVCVGASWFVSSSLFIFPHSLSYFNELTGGPRGGHAHLIDSNIDWGQDLLYLNDWLERHPTAKPVKIAFFGRFPPELAGIELQLPLGGPGDPSKTDFPVHTVAPAEPAPLIGPEPGWFAISVNHLRGVTWMLGADYRYFLLFRPVATAGYSIYLYHITPDEANEARRQLGLPALQRE